MPRLEIGYKSSPWVRCDCGKIHVVLFKSACPQCGAELNPVPQFCREKVTEYKPAVSKYSARVDVNGVEWKVCDPYPTYYRYEDNKIVMRSKEKAAPFADEKEEANG